jgi:hypothetical protein
MDASDYGLNLIKQYSKPNKLISWVIYTSLALCIAGLLVSAFILQEL